MKYCDRCITPYNRPGIAFDGCGNCNCATAEVKRAIDWDARARAWRELAADARARGSRWDCVVPVSGGKDSTWQVLTCLEAGLRPLAVTWRTPGRTAVGEANLRNLIQLGVDHVDFTVNPDVERRFMRRAFERFGSPAIPMHMALFGIPLQMAVRFAIPLVVWGENSAFEYGGEEEDRFRGEMNRDWLLRYGVTFGTTADDWVDDDLSAGDLQAYRWPSDAEMVAVGTRAVFLGYFFKWDPAEVVQRAEAAGFTREARARTGYYDYADIDDDFIAIHHWMKWHKFGFTRLFDNLSLEVRNGRMTRDEAIATVQRLGDQTPHEDIDRFCAYVGMTKAEFFEVAERFRDPDVWTRDAEGRWVIQDFLVPEWSWA